MRSPFCLTRTGLLFALTAIVTLIPCSLFGADSAKVFKAGAAVVETTPQHFPVKCNGGFVPRMLDKVNDPLFVRALVMDDGTQRVAFAIIDACGMDAKMRDEIAVELENSIGIKKEHITVASTHCHSAPALTLILGCGPDENYYPFAKAKIKEAITKANAKLQPAKVAWGVSSDPTNVFCRRWVLQPGTTRMKVPLAFTGSKGDIAQMNPGFNNPNAIAPTGVPDPRVTVLSLRTMDDKPLALVGNYSTHYAGAPNLSSDYFGVFCRRIGELLGAGSEFVALMTNGTSGDCNCVNVEDPNRKYDKETVGESVAKAAFEACQSMTYARWVPLKMEQSDLTLNIRKPDAKSVAEAKAYIAEKKLTEPKNMVDHYAIDTVLLADAAPTKTIKVQAIRVGDLGITTIPCEVYSLTGHGIKAYSPLKTTFVVSMANGYNGYIPTTEQFELGGYNTWRCRSCCLETTAEPKIRAELLRLLNVVAK